MTVEADPVRPPGRPPFHVAALGLGGNLGDPERAMAGALQALDARPDTRVVAVSKLYRTPPWGNREQPDFYNCCALIETALEPEDLLAACLDLERAMKRVRNERWGPRTLDIDVLVYEGREGESAALTLPHPRMTERAFVMVPLADIAPELIVSGRRTAEWAAGTDAAGIETAADDQRWWLETASGNRKDGREP